MMKWFNKQRGAMFSMDARIALVVGSILAGTIGVQVVQKIQRDRLELAEASAFALVKALDSYMNASPNGPMPYGYPSTFDTGTHNFALRVLEEGYAKEGILPTDSWNNTWIYDACQTNMTIEGIVVSIYYAAVYSMGPDGIADSGTNDFLTDATCQADYAAWAPANDDIGTKYTSLELQRDRVLEYKRRAQTVVAALQAYENTLFLENQRFCAIPANQTNSRCNWDTTSGYEIGEEALLNYYPRSVLDTLDGGASPGNFYYSMNRSGILGSTAGNWVFGTLVGGANFTSETLVNTLGLSTEYATDPWGRRLCYHSNASGVMEAPFLATVSYATSCP